MNTHAEVKEDVKQKRKLTNVSPETGKETRVFWKPDENALIASQAAAYLRTGAEKTVISAIRRAQEEVLPKNRQRPNLQARTSCPSTSELVDKLVAAPPPAEPTPAEPTPATNVLSDVPDVPDVPIAPPDVADRVPAEPAPVEPRPDQPSVAERVLLTLHPDEPPKPPKPPSNEQPPELLRRATDVDIEDYVPSETVRTRYVPELPKLPSRDEVIAAGAGLIEELVVASIKRVLTNPDINQWFNSLINRQLPNIIQEEAHKPPKHDPTSISVQKAVVPSVLVCGIKPGPNRDRMLQQLQGRLNVRFWYDGGGGGGAGMQKLREKMSNVTYALFTVEATSHAHVGVAKQMGVRPIRVSGATETMERALRDIAQQLGR